MVAASAATLAMTSHLYRIFPKLGITSRAQLRSVMTPVDAASRRGRGKGQMILCRLIRR